MSKTNTEKKPINQKLALERAMLRTLSEETLDEVAGGVQLQSGGHSCGVAGR